ncbi:putative acetylhydrolase [Cercophora samala]|uniref:1-alkyl-2-acetylglycerophosphocholine esterase n=1 Tax=Cercophora samala TaxID=330535 RepID=A0AA39ZB21_9PEZI|nr:putative acetylhydrolase [Cercophora samala]
MPMPSKPVSRTSRASRSKSRTSLESHASRAPPPARSFREHFFHSLAPYSGPYHVGFLEVEVPVSEPRHFSRIKRNGSYALKLDTVLFAVYYPADFNSDLPRSERRSLHRRSRKPLSRVPWLPRPRAETCKGYARFFNVPYVPITAYMAVTSMFTKLPALRNGKISSRWPPNVEEVEPENIPLAERGIEPEVKQENGNGLSQDTLVDGGQASEADKQDGKPKFPVIMFSHGLGGSRTLYSSVCGELASFGFVVVAVEHRDGSGARTFVNKAGSDPDLESQGLDRSPGPPKDEEKQHDKQNSGQDKPYYKVDYIFPKDNAQDTSPHNSRGVDTELREAQIEMRIAEIEEAFHILQLINDGKGEEVRAKNLRKKGNVGASSLGLDGIDWDEWKKRLYLENVTMMGHSFGGATSVQALRSEKLDWLSQGILLDPWGPATPESTERERLRKPILSIGSEAFMHWTENFERVEQICHEARDEGAPCWMTTIRGSTHLSQTDFAVLYPKWMSVLMKTIVNPKRAIYLTVHSALEFLKITLPPQQSRFQKSWADDQLLSKADPGIEIELDNRPNDKWVAARLRIPHEFRQRFKRTVKPRKDSTLPRDASGKPLKGLLNWGVGQEIWCHQRPAQTVLDRYMGENGWSPQ